MSAVEEVKSRLNIEDVLSEYIQLKRAGRNFKGLSPFTGEKTPSFIVSPEKQIWHDFSSGRGGDVFSFIMEVESVDFKGALELLARKAGVDLAQYQTGTKERGPSKERLLKALALATKFYQVQLKSNKTALEYLLLKRSFSKETVLEFQLGYSPDNKVALQNYLVKKGFTPQELRSAGLVTQRGSETLDMFRGRIMVPLHDSFGQTIGFTARLLEPNDYAPKYINTPSTKLYDKSRHIYGLHLAKQSIKKHEYTVLVEGNLDVIASHQAGVRHVVATAGTALTEYQLKNLSRLAPSVKLAFDQDRAGVAASERAIPIASKVGLDLSIITLPLGKDPDELIRKNKELWQEAIDASKPAFDWLLKVYRDRLNLATASGKRQFSDVLLAVVRQVPDEVEKDHYLKQISQESGISFGALKDKLSYKPAKESVLRKTVTIPVQETTKIDVNYIKTADSLLSLALMLPSMREFLLGLTPDMMPSANATKLLEFLLANPDFDGGSTVLKKLYKNTFESSSDTKQVQKMEDYVKILSLQFEERYDGKVDRLELDKEATRLRAKTIEYFVKQAKMRLRTELDSATDAKEKVLLERLRDLDKLLKKS